MRLIDMNNVLDDPPRLAEVTEWAASQGLDARGIVIIRWDGTTAEIAHITEDNDRVSRQLITPTDPLPC